MSSMNRCLVHVCGHTDVGQVRENNEDNFLIADLSQQQRRETNCTLEFLSDKRGTLFAVADGMGGASAGQLASRLAVRTLFNQVHVATEVHPILDDETVEGIILDALDTANRRIFSESSSTHETEGMGTTLTLAFEIRGRIIIGQVGDSRAYLMRKEGRISQLTQDQTMVASKVFSGEMTEIEARQHPDRNLLLQALGAQPDVKPELTQWKTLHPWDVLLLCSDGLHDQMETDEIYATVAESPDIPEAAAALVELANLRGGPDNITVVLAQFLPGSEAERQDGLKARGPTIFGS
jgi:PPM family protein phosphatase